jgi:ATP-dependent DNA ligase
MGPRYYPSGSLFDPPRERGVTCLAPGLVSQIAFQEWTADRKLRQPVFLGLRNDKAPKDCRFPENQTRRTIVSTRILMAWNFPPIARLATTQIATRKLLSEEHPR